MHGSHSLTTDKPSNVLPVQKIVHLSIGKNVGKSGLFSITGTPLYEFQAQTSWE